MSKWAYGCERARAVTQQPSEYDPKRNSPNTESDTVPYVYVKEKHFKTQFAQSALQIAPSDETGERRLRFPRTSITFNDYRPFFRVPQNTYIDHERIKGGVRVQPPLRNTFIDFFLHSSIDTYVFLCKNHLQN